MTDTVLWTGDNVDEVNAFALESDFVFCQGSNVNCPLDHDHAGGLDDGWAECVEDDSVLEVYPQTGKAFWSAAKPGDRIDREGNVTHEEES